jgi:hypothetical protein
LNIAFLLPVLAIVALLLFLFLWSLRPARKSPGTLADAASLEESGCRHALHCPQIRQALSPADFEYLAALGGKALAKQTRRERRRVVFAYLTALREDFNRLLTLGRTIAKLSPQVVALKEAERLRLSIEFLWRCRLIELRLLLGMAALPQVADVSDLVSSVTIRVEAALREMGERAAAAVQMASSVDRSGLHTV